MTLKEVLDEIWNRPGVLFPSNICLFKRRMGYKIYEDNIRSIYVMKGKRNPFKKLKRK